MKFVLYHDISTISMTVFNEATPQLHTDIPTLPINIRLLIDRCM